MRFYRKWNGFDNSTKRLADFWIVIDDKNCRVIHSLNVGGDLNNARALNYYWCPDFWIFLSLVVTWLSSLGNSPWRLPPRQSIAGKIKKTGGLVSPDLKYLQSVFIKPNEQGLVSRLN